ncbi:MAG: V-type ATP synthase subunit K [Acholeplasma sp.]|nr:V-type ATP synthase subunit K [Acholeplasma sp.]
MDQYSLALIGIGIATILSGIGSAIGVGITVRAASGVLSEKPDLFGKLLILVALPSTNGIYGFLIAILIMTQPGMPLGSALEVGQAVDGMRYLLAALPIGIVGGVAAVTQAKAAAASIYMAGKKPETSARGIVMSSLIETYPILALLVSVLVLFV